MTLKLPRGAKRRARSILLMLGGVVIAGSIAFPLYWAVAVSFQRSNIILAETPSLLPLHPVLGNFRAALSAESGSIATSLIIAFGVVVVGLLIGLPAAYGLARYRFAVSGIIVLGLLVTQMVPSVSLSLSFYEIFHKAHLLNSYVGLILADSTYAVPFVVLVLRAYMLSIPRDLFDAAAVDGCNSFEAFRRVALPLAVPGIMTGALFCFLFGWGDFLFAYTLSSEGSVVPVTLGLFKFIGLYSNDWGPIMATAVLAGLPSAAILIAAQRWVTGGLRAGALKG